MQLVNLRDFAASDNFKLITWILFFNVIFILHITVTCRQTEHDDWAHQQNADLVKLIHVGKYCTMDMIAESGTWILGFHPVGTTAVLLYSSARQCTLSTLSY